MTTIDRSYRAAEKPHEIDVRCSARLPRRPQAEGRCQLFAGHDGPHAIMYAHCSRRIVRTWKTSNPAAAADLETNAFQRPWMYGYPAPAWFETDAESSAGRVR